MRILVIDTYYPAFLTELYGRIAHLSTQSYAEQIRVLMRQCFGTSDFYSRNLSALGHESTEIVSNCEPLQRAWATEHGTHLPTVLRKRRRRGIPVPSVGREWQGPVLLAQVEAFQPDVVHFQDPGSVDRPTLLKIRTESRLVTCQIASPVDSKTPFDLYHLVLSSFPHFVTKFQREGITSHYFRLGFEPTVLERIPMHGMTGAVFVGGFSAQHAERIRFFEDVAAHQDFDWWGYGLEQLEPNSPLRRLYRGAAWGLDMYRILRGAQIALNHHIDVAGQYANNMRLYEGTGVGSLLLTDEKVNMRDHFEPGCEVATYSSSADCAQQMGYFLSHPEERAAIAAAGHARTMREHTYARRMAEYVGLVGAHIS